MFLDLTRLGRRRRSEWLRDQARAGPIRLHGIVLSLWIAVLSLYGSQPSLASALPVALCLACAARFLVTRLEISDGGVTIVNFFRTTRLPPGAVRSAGFPSPRWDGYPVPLVLTGLGFAVRANGVSTWTDMWPWPDQPVARGKRNVARVDSFFEGSGIAFDPRAPRPSATSTGP